MTTKKATIIVVALAIVSGGAVFGYILVNKSAGQEIASVGYAGLTPYSVAELSRFNGNNQSLPIFIGYEKLVYDVTSGKSFYGPGGVYQSLSGTDATAKLKFFGGDIIKSKYRAVGYITD